MIDIILAIVSIIFSYSLLPQIMMSIKTKKVEISWQTIVITVVGVFSIAICYLIKELYFGSITQFITGICWMILGILKFKYNTFKQ